MALAKVGDLVITNPSKPIESLRAMQVRDSAPEGWGIVVQVDKRKPRRGLAQYVRVQWGCKSQWHNTYNLIIVSEAL